MFFMLSNDNFCRYQVIKKIIEIIYKVVESLINVLVLEFFENIARLAHTNISGVPVASSYLLNRTIINIVPKDLVCIPVPFCDLVSA